MYRLLLAAFGLLTLALSGCISSGQQTEQQTLVDRATLSVQELAGDSNSSDTRSLMRRAKGVMICPQIFKAGFFLGGQGGYCVMSGRVADGWTNPAFYGFGSGSIGFQFGIQDAQILFIVLTDKGLRALLDSQFKIGADASVAVATIGEGVSGATTAALNADIVAFSNTRGLFIGVSLDGSLISSKSDWNQTYYGQPIGAQALVISNQGTNPGAQPLREVLAHISGG